MCPEGADLGPVKQMISTQPFIQLDSSIYNGFVSQFNNGFVSQFIFSKWQIASMRHLFCVQTAIPAIPAISSIFL